MNLRFAQTENISSTNKALLILLKRDLLISQNSGLELFVNGASLYNSRNINTTQTTSRAIYLHSQNKVTEIENYVMGIDIP
jgi:hypothetical protein